MKQLQLDSGKSVHTRTREGFTGNGLQLFLLFHPASSVSVDALYAGRLVGHVPDGWTRQGWIDSVRDRLRRVKEDDPDKTVTKLLQTELRAVEGG